MKAIKFRTSRALYDQLGEFPKRLESEFAKRGVRLRVDFVPDFHRWEFAIGEEKFPDPDTRIFARSKMLFHQFQRDHGFRFLLTERLDDFARLEALLGLPFVAKPDSGSNGRHIRLVRDREEFDAAKANRCNIAQEYVPNGDEDYRFTVVGGKVVAAIRRVARKGEFRANISQGARFEKYYPMPAEVSDVEKLAAAMRISIGGFDVFKSGLIGEVNLAATFNHTEVATGINVIGAIADYLILRSQA
ncbi:hypothetical protein IT570_03520 [Candidatus Sumerlaeota bacterium]|nr:hypothetical protein [Candidatus Sumerlaeota bacterium]